MWANDDYKMPRITVPPETAFSAKMRVVDFRQVESEPSFSLFLPSSDRVGTNSTLLPHCHFVYLKNESEPESQDSKNLHLEWFCDQDISLMVGRQRLNFTRLTVCKCLNPGHSAVVPDFNKKFKRAGRLEKVSLSPDKWVPKTPSLI